MPRKKKTYTPEEIAERRRVATERIRKYAIKPGTVLNPKGVNGAYWMNEFKLFCIEKTEPIAAEDRVGRTGKPNPNRKVARLRNVFQAMYKHALLGDENQIARVLRMNGAEVPTRMEMTGADGEPLADRPLVILRMGDAGTREDADGGEAAAAGEKGDPATPAGDE